MIDSDFNEEKFLLLNIRAKNAKKQILKTIDIKL